MQFHKIELSVQGRILRNPAAVTHAGPDLGKLVQEWLVDQTVALVGILENIGVGIMVLVGKLDILSPRDQQIELEYADALFHGWGVDNIHFGQDAQPAELRASVNAIDSRFFTG